MWHDVETTKDYLNYNILANTAAQMIYDAHEEPLSIGVSGSWGSGKSSLVKMIAAELKNISKPDERKYVFLDFNAWLYQGYDDARSALLQSVSDLLEAESKERKPTGTKVLEFVKRVKWFKLGKMLTPIAIGAVTGGSIAGPIGGLIGAAKGVLDNIGNLQDKQVNSLRDAYTALSPELSDLLKEKATRSLPQEINELRKCFLETLNELDITLVVFVDDLDRCLPPTAIATLEAIRLLLFMQRTAFIIAADEQMIRSAVNLHFGGEGISKDMSTSYFDKLIQVPLRIPRPGINEIKVYLAMLFVEKLNKQNKIDDKGLTQCERAVSALLQRSWGSAITLENLLEACKGYEEIVKPSMAIADQIAPTMASAQQINGNPRLIKRFLNNLEIRESMARVQGISITYNILVKLQLFERCASASAYNYLVKEVTESKDGVLGFLAEAEKAYSNDESYEFTEESWQDDFTVGWSKLSPTLGAVDLRPYLYLSRSHTNAFVAYDMLSEKAQALIEAVQSVSAWSDALAAQIRQLPETECSNAFQRVIQRAKANQWPEGCFIQAYLFAYAYPALLNQLANELKDIPAQMRTKTLSLIPLIRNKEQMKALLNEWEKDGSTPTSVKRAIQIRR